MKDQSEAKSVICFGEILWDVLPTGKKPGGAPMNVAYHLHNLGINSRIISRVGYDDAGSELFQFLNAMGLSYTDCQIDPEHATSEVHAKIGDNHEVSYDILYPVAWDYISWEDSFESLLGSADAFVFGSLSARNTTTRETLFRMLETAPYRVFDINMRKPHYSAATVGDLLLRTDLLKLNEHELSLVSEWFNRSAVSEGECVETLQEKFGITEIIVTKGSRGASYYTPSARYDYPAYPVEVADTVGSGDSFLAAFLAMKLKQQTIETTLDYAAALGAFITTHTGACPDYKAFDLERFIWMRSLGVK